MQRIDLRFAIILTSLAISHGAFHLISSFLGVEHNSSELHGNFCPMVTNNIEISSSILLPDIRS